MERLATVSTWWALLVFGAGAASTLHAASCRPETSRPAYGERSFLGYACRDAECAAHKAGFAWADRQGISDPAACVDAEDAAFVEGCRAFAELAVTAEQSGFEWARENELADDCLCSGAGHRFAAGCEAYVGGFAH
ncbi:MAG TPA: hypothetical protein VFI92_07080 [Steroidobacteraceae bacterium]|nr:hypothetical protein [Steroidobacteraceae bacterium]